MRPVWVNWSFARRRDLVCAPLPGGLPRRMLFMANRFARPFIGAASKLSNSGSRRMRRAPRASVLAAAIEPLEIRAYLSTTPPIVSIDWKGTTAPAYQGQYIVQAGKLKAFEALATAKGFTVKDLGGNSEYEITTALSPSAVGKMAASHKTAIKTIAPNGVVQATDTFPNDTYAPLQYYLQNTGQTEPYDYNGDGVVTTPGSGYPSPPYPNEAHVGTVGQDLNLAKAWDITTGSPNVVVAVLDTGIDLTHPDLVNNIFVNPYANPTTPDNAGYIDDVNGWNFVSDNNNVSDDNGHGTNVAGIIGAQGNNSQGIAGINWNVKILPVKVLDADGLGSEAFVIAGVNYVTALKDEGVNIVAINESLTDVGFPLNVVSSNAVKAAGKVGIVDVVAAGDSSANNDRIATNPQQFDSSIPTVISVAATDNQGNLALFSNYGSQTVDLAAPGIDIYSTAPTYPVTLDSPPTPPPLGTPAFGLNYGYLSGTSQAAPQVTGIIALEASVKPNATPAQLKKALLDGVTYDPALASVNGTPAKVRTSGVANAYNAINDIMNQYVSTDTLRAGNWSGFYGSQGAYVVGDTTAFPSFVTATFNGATPVIVNGSTNKTFALQKVSDLSSRIEAFDASASAESINLSFTDGQSHLTRLYVADYDKQKRSEAVQIIDTATGAVLDTQNVSNFKKGEYLTWDLQGNVTIKLTNLSGPSAVFSGLFFDTPPANPNVFQGTDTTTQGTNWQNQYGSQGEYVVGDPNGSALPGYAKLSVNGQTTQVVQATSHSKYALQKVGNYKQNVAAYWSSTSSFTIGLNLTDGQAHNVTLYTADFKHKNQAERIQVLDVTTGAVLYTQDLSSLGMGTFSTFDVTGDVQFIVSNTGGKNAVVNGLFLDGPPGALVSFAGADNTTQGNWRAAGYGPVTAYVAGQNFAGIDNLGDPTITVTGAQEYVQSNTSTNPVALDSINSSVANRRIESYLYTTTSMTLNVNFADTAQHRVELYFADYENDHRSETIAMYNTTTGALLTTQRISNFEKGRYLIYDMRGPVSIVITDDTAPNAVLSGFFAD